MRWHACACKACSTLAYPNLLGTDMLGCCCLLLLYACACKACLMTLCMTSYIIQYNAHQCFKSIEMLENRNEQQMPDSSGCQTYIVLAIVVQNSTQLPWGAKKYIVRKTLTSGSSENFLRQGGLQPSMALTWLRPCV
jgi:hypothetical protein